MNITLTRTIKSAAYTLGSLVIAGSVYFSVEDTVRPLTDCTKTTCVGKINGQTAIPAGTYEIKDTYSPKYGRKVLELQNVPGFQGIRIHSGNTVDDTEGCLILGLARTSEGVARSREAMAKFNEQVRAILATGERVYITIKDE